MLNQIKLYGEIGADVTAVDVKKQLDAMDHSQPLLVRIHSEGGSVPDGLAIYDAFREYEGPKRAVIESAALSIASHIAMAFEDVEITENGYLMIHSPHMDVKGDDIAHAKAAETLSKMKHSMINAYSEKTGKSKDEIVRLLESEQWINASEALAAGYVNRIKPPKVNKIAAKMKNMPQGVFSSLYGERSDAGEKREERKMSEAKPVAASLAEIRAALPKSKAKDSDFILRCIEKELPLASVITDALSAMEEELSMCKAKLAQYEQDMAVKAEMEISVEEEPKEEPVMQSKAQAKSGVKPVAKAIDSSKPSAKSQWDSLVSAKVTSGLPKAKAVAAVHRENPGLREQMVEEINLARKDDE